MKNQKSWEAAANYTLRLGPNADELLDLLGDYYFAKSPPECRAANMARQILQQALVDIDKILPRALAAGDYFAAEGVEGMVRFLKYMDDRLPVTSKEVIRRFRKRKKAR